MKKGCSYLCMWTKKWLERNGTWIRFGKYSIKKSIWENQHHSSTMFYLGCTQRESHISEDIVDKYRSVFEFLPGLQKNCPQQKPRGNLVPKQYLHGLMIWKVMLRNAWKDIANLRIKRRSNCTKSQRHAHCMLTNGSEMFFFGTYWEA